MKRYRDELNKKKKLGTAILLTAAASVAVTGGALGSVGNYFYNMVIKRGPKDFLIKNERLEGNDALPSIPVNAERQAEYEEWLTSVKPEYVEINSYDKLRLTGRIYRAGEEDNHNWVIAVHGYNASSSQMKKPAFEFATRMGMNTLAVDCRGHGDSAGSYIGMGWHDRLDVISWVNYIIEKDPKARIVLYGISMGAAAVLMASGEKLPPEVRCVIEDCGYTSVWDELAWQMERAYKIKPFPALNAAEAVCRMRAGYGFKKASAVSQLKKCRLPILFIHGEEDRFVPYPMVFALYQEAKRPKDIFTVPGAGHAKASVVDPEGYWSRVSAFVEKHLNA